MPLFSRYSDQQFEQLRAERDAEAARANSEAERVAGEAAKAKELSEKNELLLAQLHQVQEELERMFLQGKQLEDAATQSSADLTALTLRVADLEGKLVTETARTASEAAKCKDLQEENDLLLAQLHQVQEELERYYLVNKDLESTLADTTESLQNIRRVLVTQFFDSRGYFIPPADPAHKTVNAGKPGRVRTQAAISR